MSTAGRVSRLIEQLPCLAPGHAASPSETFRPLEKRHETLVRVFCKDPGPPSTILQRGERRPVSPVLASRVRSITLSSMNRRRGVLSEEKVQDQWQAFSVHFLLSRQAWMQFQLGRNCLCARLEVARDEQDAKDNCVDANQQDDCKQSGNGPYGDENAKDDRHKPSQP